MKFVVGGNCRMMYCSKREAAYGVRITIDSNNGNKSNQRNDIYLSLHDVTVAVMGLL